MAALTLFSFGYHGWGNATDRLVEAADAVERARGFEPPLFADVRIRRTVRAAGFNGPAFERCLGPARHRWLPGLGNRHIVTGEGPLIQIAEPAAAEGLLDLALAAGEKRQRVIFFCGCRWPREGGEVACHRVAVAELVLDAARRRGLAAEVVEWPGGEPRAEDLLATEEQSRAARNLTTIPLEGELPLASQAGLPWGSLLRVHAAGGVTRCLVGPAFWQKRRWALPKLPAALPAPLPGVDDPEARWGELAGLVRAQFGLAPLRS